MLLRQEWAMVRLSVLVRLSALARSVVYQVSALGYSPPAAPRNLPAARRAGSSKEIAA
jgi:hypothetical protein